MKNILSYVGIFLLIFFSFFITDKIALVVKQSDPLMDEINSIASDYNIDVVEAETTDNTIIPGINGCNLDIDNTYEEAKKIGTISKNLVKYNIIYPKQKLNKNYDKYIISGNKLKSDVSIIFKIYNNTNQNNIEKIINIITDTKIETSIFIDGMYLENNTEYVEELFKNNIEVLNLGYNKKYNKDLINWNNTILNELNYNNPKFCYLENFSINDLTVCKNNNMKTVIPNIIVDKKPLITVKNNIENGSIISFDINDELINELKLVINYINSKGYKMVKLSDLLSENNEKCK